MNSMFSSRALLSHIDANCRNKITDFYIFCKFEGLTFFFWYRLWKGNLQLRVIVMPSKVEGVVTHNIFGPRD